MAVALAVLAAIGVGVFTVQKSSPAAPSTPAPMIVQDTLLLVLSLRDDLSHQADSLTVFAAGHEGDRPVALFIPVGTLGTIPGQGFEAIGRALSVQSLRAQRLAVENLLGIEIDETQEIDDAVFSSFVDELGGIEIRDGDSTADNGPGSSGSEAQRMSGSEAVRYLTHREESGTEIQRFVRARRVWDAVAAAKPEDIERALTNTAANSLERDGRRALARALGWFAATEPGARGYEVLPVDIVGSGGSEEVYAVQEDGLDALVRRRFTSSAFVRGQAPSMRPRAEIRNGNGTPEAGLRAADALIRGGIRIALTGNAPSFDVATTRIIGYSDDAAGVALSRDVRELLGLGRVEFGTRGQTVVDVTVVLGKDFAGEGDSY
ncbi:MAG: LCP family protein [Actinomycetota bacterium]